LIALYRELARNDLTLYIRSRGADHFVKVPDQIELNTWQHFVKKGVILHFC
jgi:hypothetical protein